MPKKSILHGKSDKHKSIMHKHKGKHNRQKIGEMLKKHNRQILEHNRVKPSNQRIDSALNGIQNNHVTLHV